MPRIGPYVLMTLAGIMLLLAITPALREPLLELGGLRAAEASGAFRSFAFFVPVGCGLMIFGVSWLWRIGRLERGWFAFRDALTPLAERGRGQVRLDYPHHIRLEVPGSTGVSYLFEVVPQGRVGVWGTAGREARTPLAVVPDDQLGFAAKWPIVLSGRGWSLRSPRPERMLRLSEDAPLQAALDLLFRSPGLVLIRHDERGIQLQRALVEADFLPREVERSVEVFEHLIRLNGANPLGGPTGG